MGLLTLKNFTHFFLFLFILFLTNIFAILVNVKIKKSKKNEYIIVYYNIKEFINQAFRLNRQEMGPLVYLPLESVIKTFFLRNLRLGLISQIVSLQQAFTAQSKVYEKSQSLPEWSNFQVLPSRLQALPTNIRLLGTKT